MSSAKLDFPTYTIDNTIVVAVTQNGAIAVEPNGRAVIVQTTIRLVLKRLF